MSYAKDLLNLRHEIESLRSARVAMVHGLKKSVARSMADFRKAFNNESARARAARKAFTSGMHERVQEMMGAFNAERAAAHRNFHGKRA